MKKGVLHFTCARRKVFSGGPDRKNSGVSGLNSSGGANLFTGVKGWLLLFVFWC